LQELVEQLATYPSATAAFRVIVPRLTLCKRTHDQIDGATLTGNLWPVGFGHLGVNSAVFAVTFIGSCPALADDVAMCVAGQVILGIDEGGYAPINSTQFASVISRAAKRHVTRASRWAVDRAQSGRHAFLGVAPSCESRFIAADLNSGKRAKYPIPR